MDEAATSTALQGLQVWQEAERTLGDRAWVLVSCYGRMMDGPHVGRYVSGLPFSVQLELIRQLVRGETVPVHLMHRHRSGHYESSSLRWSQHGLVMVFRNREEPI